jgi:hypothetical protein
MARRQYKLGQRARLNPEVPFTPDKLQRLIGDALGDRYAPPADAEAEKLCSILNHWHAWFYKAQELRDFNAAVEETKAAIEKLQVVLPVIVNHHLAQAERGDPFARWQAEAAGDLLIAVRKDPQRVTHRSHALHQGHHTRAGCQPRPDPDSGPASRKISFTKISPPPEPSRFLHHHNRAKLEIPIGHRRSPAGSCLGGFRTPAHTHRRDLRWPASENLHHGRHSTTRQPPSKVVVHAARRYRPRRTPLRRRHASDGREEVRP